MNAKERRAYELGLRMGRVQAFTEVAIQRDKRDRIISGIVGIIVGTVGPVLIANKLARWYRS